MLFGLPHEARKELLDVTGYWLRKISQEKLEALGREILSALRSAAESPIPPASPRNKIIEAMMSQQGGLLGGATSPDLIEVAFGLWIGRKEPFYGLIQREGLYDVLSIVGWIALSDAKAASLVRLNSFLAKGLVFLAEDLRKEAAKNFRATHGLAQGPRASSEMRARLKVERNALLVEAAYQYRANRNSNATNEEIAAFLAEKGSFGKFSTIRRKLAGTKEAFVKAMATRRK